MTSQIDQLTDKQLEAVRGVAELKSAKEIARELDVSSHAIEARLKHARATLGVDTSAEAARLYREHVRPVDGHSEASLGETVYGPSELSGRPRSGDQEPSPGTWNRSDDEPTTLHQPQAAYLGDWVHEAPSRSWKTVLLETSQTNTLSPLARTLCIGALTLLAMLSMAVAVSLAEGFSRMF